MRALSIRQPWIWAILNAGKRIENRDWSGCAVRGPLLLHASKGTGTLGDFDDDVETLCSQVHRSRVAAEVAEKTKARGRIGEIWRPRPDLIRGGIVGVCNLVDAVHSSPDPWFFGPLGLVLADVRALPFTPFSGDLGFFDVPDDIAGPLLGAP